MKKALYIAVEGIDGAGKTTQSRLLVKTLRSKGIRTILTSEPTDMPIGKLIKKELNGKRRFSEDVLALLFAADRLMHNEKVIKPALKKGITVVSDRSVISSLAYQTVATSKRKWVELINKFAARPDVVIFIDVEPSKALRRLRKAKATRYEKLKFQKAVDREYRRILRRGWKIVHVYGGGTVEQVYTSIVKGLARFIPELRK